MAVTGEWNRCPFCRTPLWAGASERWILKPCPRCGAELWVVGFSAGAMFFMRQPGQSLHDFVASLAALVCPKFGVTGREVKAELGRMDSLDLLDFVFQVEEAMQSDQGEPGFGG